MATDMTPDRRTMPFDIVAFFEGKSRAFGIVEDRRGRVKRTMTIELTGRRFGNCLELHEAFTYGDGAREERTWTFTKMSDTTYQATCADCVGTALGTSRLGGADIGYEFRLKLPKHDRTMVVRFDDRFTQVSETTVINRATISKWGVRLGEVFLVLQRLG